MLNNHLGTVKRMLQEAMVDVNGKDDKGRTLLAMAMLDIEEPKCVEFAKFLIEKGADVNLGDVDKTTPLHILAQTVFSERRHDKKDEQREKDFN
jgi:ankyrin repeat protein